MIPKIAYFYWNKETNLSYLRYTTLLTFRKLHPDWTINLYYSDSKKCAKWAGGEDQDFFTNNKENNYFNSLKNLDVNVLEYKKHTEKAPNYISDFFRWDILNQTGGWYFDLDQIFIKNFDGLCKNDFVIDGSPSCFVGVVGSIPNCKITDFINKNINILYNPDFYNCIGPWFIKSLFQKPGDPYLLNLLKEYRILLTEREVFYPVHPDNVLDIFEKDTTINNSYCIHWYGGHPISQKYNKLLTENNFSNYKNTITNNFNQVMNIKPAKITFGIIVVNGEPWIEPLLKNIYDQAYSICIAEGATKNWKDTNNFQTPRSTDNTLSIIKNFPDPGKKIRLITPDNFYEEKLEQCNTWLQQAPKDTDYVWEVDTDEFYHKKDIDLMINLLTIHQYTYVEFPVLNFFKSMDYIATGGDGWGYDTPFPRIFKYYPGCKWDNHRPPTILDQNGTDYRNINPLNGKDNPIKMYHYSYVTDKQVLEKIRYYTKTFNRDYYNEWYLPFYKEWTPENRIALETKYSAHPSRPNGKTKRFNKKHPDIIQQYFKTKNENIIIRLDDFPTGIRPLLKDITPLVEILSKFCYHFKNVNLGIIPKLLTPEYFSLIKDLEFNPCIHGYDHHYFQFSKLLDKDPFNKNTILNGFNEFENNSKEEIRNKLKESKDILEQYFQKDITTYIPPCNIIDENTKEILQELNLQVNSELGFYGRLLEMDMTKKLKFVTLHLTWEYDDLTWKNKNKEEWLLKLEELKNENMV